VLAVVAAVFWGFLWYGLIDLSVVIEQDERFHQHYLLESGWGLLFTVLLAVPMVVLAVRPGDLAALAQLVVVTVAVLVGAVWGAAIPQLWNALGLAVTAGLLILLGGWAPVRWRRPDLVLSALSVIGLVAAVIYGAPLAGNTTDVEDITIGVSHYPMQASFAIAIAGVVALAAVTRSRLPAWTAAFSAVWLGVESMIYPDLRGSLGTIGGALAVAWAAVVVLGLEIARRRTPPPVRTTALTRWRWRREPVASKHDGPATVRRAAR
jgi:hypothetical protein